jgi:two-component system, chemotaxis family, sensor kinase CheA
VTAAEPDSGNELFLEFLGDYFAECDDHLRIVRNKLLSLEHDLSESAMDRAMLDELFRSFHSLKGISGMVGLREAEQLAHQMESYLRALRENQLKLTQDGVDALLNGATTLEEVIGAFRAGSPISDIAPIMGDLARLLPDAMMDPTVGASEYSHKPGSATGGATAGIVATTQGGVKLWRFVFAPSVALAGRGINVNSVRERLQGIGRLIQCSPTVMEQGRIAFELLVASGEDEAAFAAWRIDGLTYEAAEPEEPEAAIQEDRRKAAAKSSLTQSFRSSNLVRVDLARLDELMRLVGDLVITRSRLDDNLKRLESTMPATEWRPLQESNFAMERQLRDLREGIVSVRMVPIGEIFERMQFAVRDLAREYQKEVRVELVGSQTEIDKLLVERMMDPVLHLVRNAVSHGLESPPERAAAGKPAQGRVSLRAYTAAQMVVIEIEDDGRGLDSERIAKRAVQMGLIASEASVDVSTLLDLICTPGFSTREEADRASGRGVGMAVVRSAVSGLGGSLELETEVGRGTTFRIQVPLTLAIAKALIVSAGGQTFAVPQSTVVEVLEVEATAVKVFENNEVVAHREGILTLVRLARLFQLTSKATASFHVFVVRIGSNIVGIVVDRILGQREIVVRAVSDPMAQAPGIGGATELGDGRIILILDAADLIRRAATPVSSAGQSALV